MSFKRDRHIEPEVLDDQSPDRAIPSLRDIVRINKITGGHRVLRKALQSCVATSEAFTMLDVGAASGDAARVVAAAYPRARVVNLDYRPHHLTAAVGMRAVADAFHLPFPDRSFDIVYCGLFLHHFDNESILRLLRSFGCIARRFVIVNDLERHILPWYFLEATKWIFRWDPLTLHDGPISVQAGFSAKELEHLARGAGLVNPEVIVHRPAFRVCLLSRPALS